MEGSKVIESDEIRIRRAEPADAEVLAELASRTFQEAFAADNNLEDMALHVARSFGPARQLAEITAPDTRTLLAVSGSQVIGFTQLRTGTPPACVASADPVELWRIYVDRPWHGRGVAQQLMGAAITEARAMGAGSVWLGVWERNPRAITFYGKCGFVDVGTHNFLLGEDLQTDRVMVLSPLPA